MEKEKILAWLDRLVELDKELHEVESFDPEKENPYQHPTVCVWDKGQIHLYSAVREICRICGFEMKSRKENGGLYTEIRFYYKECYFFECVGEYDEYV